MDEAVQRLVQRRLVLNLDAHTSERLGAGGHVGTATATPKQLMHQLTAKQGLVQQGVSSRIHHPTHTELSRRTSNRSFGLPSVVNSPEPPALGPNAVPRRSNNSEKNSFASFWDWTGLREAQGRSEATAETHGCAQQRLSRTCPRGRSLEAGRRTHARMRVGRTTAAVLPTARRTCAGTAPATPAAVAHAVPATPPPPLAWL